MIEARLSYKYYIQYYINQAKTQGIEVLKLMTIYDNCGKIQNIQRVSVLYSFKPNFF